MRRSGLHRRVLAAMKHLDIARGERALAALTPKEITALIERLKGRYQELTGESLVEEVVVRYVNDWRNATHADEDDEDDDESGGM